MASVSLQQTAELERQDTAPEEECKAIVSHHNTGATTANQEPHRENQPAKMESMSEGEDDAFYSSAASEVSHQLPGDGGVSLNELSFLYLPSQSNVYSMAAVNYLGSNKLLIATLRGEIFKLEYEKRSLRPSFKPVPFSYIPADAELISIDAFVRPPHEPVVGVTLIKGDVEPKEVYFNVYGHHTNSSSSSVKWDNIAEDWQPISLKFTPFQLTHTQMMVGDHWETVFLLAGDDLCVHLYRPVPLSEEVCFQEEANTTSWFPELQHLPSSVTHLHIQILDCRRVTALGCQNGYLRCSMLDLTNNTILHSFNTHSLDGPISSVQLFTISTTPANDEGDVPLHLLATSATEVGAVFRNVFHGEEDAGGVDPLVLPESSSHDSVLCSTVGDLTWSQRNQLVLGTYGKTVLVYQLVPAAGGHGELVSADLIWYRQFAHPIHRVWHGDLTGDGVKELVVVTMGGVHIMQHDLNQACLKCVSKYQYNSTITNNIRTTNES